MSNKYYLAPRLALAHEPDEIVVDEPVIQVILWLIGKYRIIAFLEADEHFEYSPVFDALDRWIDFDLEGDAA